jgi:hypothetical protein
MRARAGFQALPIGLFTPNLASPAPASHRASGRRGAHLHRRPVSPRQRCSAEDLHQGAYIYIYACVVRYRQLVE